MNGRTRVLLAALLFLGAVAPPAQAVILGGKTSTQTPWFNDFRNDSPIGSAGFLRVSVVGANVAGQLRDH